MDNKSDGMGIKKSSIKRNLASVIGIGVVVLIIVCVGCYSIVKIVNSDPEVQATGTARGISRITGTAQAILDLTETARPTRTPEPTSTPSLIPTQTNTVTNTPTYTLDPSITPPTSTSTSTSTTTPTPTPSPTSTNTPTLTSTPTEMPTLTPLPVAPTCQEILTAKHTMTDVQWENFQDGMGGLWIVDWTGSVEEVGDKSLLLGGYPMTVRITSDCDLYFVVPDEETALMYSKGQKITITAQIDFLQEFFGFMTLHLEEFTVEIK